MAQVMVSIFADRCRESVFASRHKEALETMLLTEVCSGIVGNTDHEIHEDDTERQWARWQAAAPIGA